MTKRPMIYRACYAFPKVFVFQNLASEHGRRIFLSVCRAAISIVLFFLHYSLFGYWPAPVEQKFLSYLAESKGSYKIAFFQDEYHFCRLASISLSQFGINCITHC